MGALSEQRPGMLLNILRCTRQTLTSNTTQIKVSMVLRLTDPDIKRDEVRALGTPPEDHDASGTETVEEQSQNRKEHPEYLVPRTPREDTGNKQS